MADGGENSPFHVLNNRVYSPATSIQNGNAIQVSGNGSLVKGNIAEVGEYIAEGFQVAGILVVNASDVVVEDNEVFGKDMGISVQGGRWPNEAATRPARDVIIRNNNIHDIELGVRIYDDSQDITITGNTFVNVLYAVGVGESGGASFEVLPPVHDLAETLANNTFPAGFAVLGDAILLVRTVSFETNGGTPIEAIKVADGKKVGTPDEPTKVGHTFVGWFTTEAMTEAFDFGVAINEDLTIYVKWSVNQYTITYEIEGEEPVVETYNFGAAITIEIPLRAGYTFFGWNPDPNTLPETMPAENLVLTGRYERITYNVTLQVEGEEDVVEVVDYNSKLTEPDKPVKEGYVFDGWYLGEVKFDFETIITENITLVARFEEPTVVMTILAAREKEIDEEVTIKGVLTSYGNNNTYFIQDSTAAISLFVKDSPDEVKTLLAANIRSEFIITGTMAKFYGSLQIVPSEAELIGAASSPFALSLDNLELNAASLLPHQSKLASITRGTVSAYNKESNGTVSFTLIRTDGQSIPFRWDYRVTNLPANAIAMLNGLENGQTIDLENAILGWHNNPQLLPSQTIFVQYTEFTNEEKLQMVEDDLINEFDGKSFYMQSNVELSTIADHGITITWQTTPANAVVEGKWMEVEVDTPVTLTATLTLNSVTVVVQLDVTVLYSAVVYESHTVVASSAGSPTNMIEGINPASTLKLSDEYFKVSASQGEASAVVGLYADLRVYGHSGTGDGNELVIEILKDAIITKVEINFGSSTNEYAAKITLGSQVITLTKEETSGIKVYDELEISEFAIKNIGSGGSGNPQVRINSIAITYLAVKEPEVELTDAEKVLADKNALDLAKDSHSEGDADFVLPTEGSIHGSTITWASSHSAIINASTGKVTHPSETTEVTLTATLAIGSASLTKDFSITVYAPQETSELMIYEVYGGGGNSGAVYTHDYVVLYNAGTSDIELKDYSIQYAGADKGFTQYQVLNGKIKAKGYYLIQLASGNNGVSLPLSPNATGTINISATNFKLALVQGTDLISSPNDPSVVDFLGAGTANAYEGSGTALAGSNDKSVKRTSLIDTNNNRVDFGVVTANLNYLLTEEQLNAMLDLDAIELPTQFEDGDSNLSLPTSGTNGSTIGWVSSNPAVIATTGVVTIPEDNVEVTLTATVTNGSEVLTKDFKINVKGSSAPDPNVPVVVTLQYANGSGTKNMKENTNYAADLGLSQFIFSVTAVKNKPSSIIGLNDAGHLRIYGDKGTGDGNDLIVQIDEDYVITSVKIKFGASTNSATASIIFGANDPIDVESSSVKNGEHVTTELSINSFAIKNTHKTTGSVGQVFITYIEITYSPKA